MTRDVWAQLLEMIREKGWAIQSVFGDEATPPFAYTVGMCDHGLPDLLMTGLPPQYAHPILDLAARRLMVERFKGEHGELLHGIANMPLAPRVASPILAGEVALAARRYSALRDLSFTCIQIVLPDRAGLFPWDEGYATAMHQMQQLYLPSDPDRRLDLPSGIRSIVDGAEAQTPKGRKGPKKP